METPGNFPVFFCAKNQDISSVFFISGRRERYKGVRTVSHYTKEWEVNDIREVISFWMRKRDCTVRTIRSAWEKQDGKIVWGISDTVLRGKECSALIGII